MDEQMRRAHLTAARQRLENGIMAIDQVTNRELPTDMVRAGAALAEANFHAADLLLRLAEAG